MDLRELRYRGTQVAYSVVCERKLWLFSRGVSFEHLSEWVQLGRLLDERSFRREREEDFYDEPVRVDFIRSRRGLVVHEVKHSRAIETAHELQVKYYIYYLRKKGLEVSHGVIHYPRARQIREVYLTQEDEGLIEDALLHMGEVLSLSLPPPVIDKPYCKKCAYEEFCYG
ncbi:MAG: CRISPR-associated protein Cas4 [Aquificaceae bacterium]|jgi:CRISPR-associated exonuclease Cas4|uniref:CRISPR-associated protein Cas4 n=1 Tax=Hydrogenobacter sp. Uz 6-8 TaxID=3384828 RepID=UPI000F1A8C6B|nr:MAG: CRISPR-associated protein Cas4 [Aquificota bacterium]